MTVRFEAENIITSFSYPSNRLNANFIYCVTIWLYLVYEVAATTFTAPLALAPICSAIHCPGWAWHTEQRGSVTEEEGFVFVMGRQFVSLILQMDRGEDLPRGKVRSLALLLPDWMSRCCSGVGLRRADGQTRWTDSQKDRQAKISPAVIQNPAVWLE